MAEKQTDSESKSGSGVGSLIVGWLFVGGLLYVGGWSLIWKQDILSFKAFTFDSHGFTVRFNNLYYGVGITNRFFDSPVISWLCLMLVFGFLFCNEDDE